MPNRRLPAGKMSNGDGETAFELIVIIAVEDVVLAVVLVVHNQDNREHDVLDSDDYYQFEGGLAVAIRHLSGRQPTIWHGDHSRPESPRIRTLEDEIGRVVRARAVNPKWLAGVMRH